MSIERHIIKEELDFDIIRCNNVSFVWWEIYSDHYPYYYGDFRKLKEAKKVFHKLITSENLRLGKSGLIPGNQPEGVKK